LLAQISPVIQTLCRMRRLVIFLLILSSLCLPCSSLAAGSVSWAEIRTVLKQDSALLKFVETSLDCYSSGSGNRVGGMFPLGGKRLGPYYIRCRQKGSKSDYSLALVVNTSAKLLDDSGSEVDITKATRIEETLESIQLKSDPCKEKYCKGT